MSADDKTPPVTDPIPDDSTAPQNQPQEQPPESQLSAELAASEVTADQPAAGAPDPLAEAIAQSPAVSDAAPAPESMQGWNDAPAQASPVEASPVEASPVEASPVEASPVEASPVEASPVETPPAEVAPTAVAPAPEGPALEQAGAETPEAIQQEALEAIDVDLSDEVDEAPAASAPAAAPEEEEPRPEVTMAQDAQASGALPTPGAPGSQPAPFDPREAPLWQALLAEYEREIQAIGEVPASAILHYESGRLWEEKLAQPRNAWTAYNHAFQLLPGMVPNIRAARRLAAQVGNWNVTVQIIESEIEAAQDPRHKAYLMLSRGLVLEDKLGKQDEARAAYQAALQLAPDNLEVLRELERLAIINGDWKTVLQIRAQVVELITDPPIEVQLLLSSARIELREMNDKKKAEALYEQVLDREPNNGQAIEGLRQLYAESGRHEKAMEMTMRLAEKAEDGAQAASLYYQAARLQRDQLSNAELAIEILRKAVAHVPEDHMFLGELAMLLESLMRWQELVEIYERQVELIKDRQELVTLYFKLGNIWEEKLFNEDRAIPNYRKVVELNPNYLPALQSLGKLFYRKGQWDDLVKMYEMEIRETADEKQRSAKLYKLAEILEERLNRDEEAIHKFEQCLELNPGFLPALKALGRLYGKYSRWESLIQMYENELAVTTDHDQAVFLLDKIGGLWEEKLNNVDKAIATQQRILERAPNYLPAIRTLGKLYVRADAWENLIRINELESQLVNDQKQVISLLHRNGEICEEKLNDKDRAIATYREVLTLAPAYLPALQSLGRLYFIKGMWDELISMYRQEIEVTQNEAQKITLLYKIGELYEDKLVQEESAIAAYREVLDIQAGNFPALKALSRIFTAKRDWENLIEVLERESAVLEDDQQKTLALFRMAEIWELRLGRDDKAVETLNRILDLVAAHPPTAQALRRLHTKGQNWRELLAIHERELSAAQSVDRQVHILYAMAEIQATQLNDLAQAAATHERILGLQPDHLQSLEALERLYLAQRNNAALVKVYQALVARTNDPQLVITFEGQIADLKENRLQPPKNAGEHYLKMLNLDPTHPEATRALDILYHKLGTWQGLRVLYERELARAPTMDEAIDLCMRIADLAENRLDQAEVAIHYYRETLKLDGDHLPAIKALKRIYKAQNDSQAMLELLQLEGQVTRDPAQGIATLHEAGRLYREQFNDPGRSIECFFKILERDPTEVRAFEQLEELLTGQQDWERLAVLYRNRLGTSEDSRTLADLNTKLGHLLLHKLQRAQDAATSYRAVLALNPSHIESLSALSSITFDAGLWDESVQFAGRLLELSNDAEVIKKTHFRLGIVYQEKKPDLDRAVSHLDQVIAAEPGNVEALQRLRVIHSARQRWQEAIDVLTRLEQVDAGHRVDHILEQANIFETGLNDPDRAVEALRKVQQIDPGNATVVQKMGELYERLERWSDLVEAYGAFIRLLPPDRRTDAIPLHMKSGALFGDRLNNTDKAIIEYKSIVDLEPNHIEAHVALANLYGKTGLYYANAVDEHRKLLDIDPFRLDSFHEMRRIFEEQRAFDKVFCVCAVMHYLRTADQNEEFFYGENVSKAPDKSQEVLTEAEVERLCIHPAERGIVRKIMMIIGPVLQKVFPADLAHHGVGKGDRARQDDPLRTLAVQMVTNLGEFPFEIYRSTQPTHLVVVENTSPQGLIVGEGLVKRTQVKEQRFALGRALKRVMDGSMLATQLGPKQLAQLIAAAVMPYHPSSPVATFPSTMPDGLMKKVGKALPRKNRKALEDLLKQNAPDLARVPNYEAYLQGIEHSAIRVGLALSNDLANAFMHLSREIPALDGKRYNSTQEIIQAMSAHPTLCELLRFAVSEEYFNLRARLKMSILN